jgi:hypothetical protein
MKLNTPLCKTVVTSFCVLSLSPALVFAGGIAGVMGDLSVGQNPEESGADYVADTTGYSEERGVIKSVDLSAHTLVVTEHKKNTEQTFQWNDQTKFTERHKSASPGDLKEGERVRLTYAPDGSAPILQTVHIAPAKAAKSSANNTSPARSNGA